MPGPRLQKAEQTATEVLKRWHVESPPVPVDDLAKCEGLSLRSEMLEDDVSAMLVLAPESQPVIVVNSSHHQHRRRFSIAHEIGHFALHSGKSTLFVEFRDARAAMAIDPKEIEANAFAAALLMPRRLLRVDLRHPRFRSLDVQAVTALARRYEVSEQAMKFRLVNLGIVAGFED